VTPYGVVWANSSGVWISDGRMPEKMTGAVPALYESLATGKPYPYDSALNFGNIPAWPSNKNPYLEVSYDPFEDEIIVSTPVSTYETGDSGTNNPAIFNAYDLIWSFEKKSWRMESLQSKIFDSPLSEMNINDVSNF